MSHIATIELKINSLEAIEALCKRKGWTFHRNKTSFKWYGNWVGDTTPPKNIFTPQELKDIEQMADWQKQNFYTKAFSSCSHAISIPGCAYEIGLKKIADGSYVPIWDHYTPGGLHTVLGEPNTAGFGAPILQGYAIERAKIEARRLGYYCYETTLDTGAVELTIHAN